MPKTLTLAFAFAFLLTANILSSSAFAQPSYSAKTDFTLGAGSNATSIITGDINGDGKPDLISSNFNSSDFSTTRVSVYLNTTTTGASTPTFSTATNFTTGLAPYCVALADINGDGKPDIVTANYYQNTISVLFNTTATGAATPTFAAKSDIAFGFGPYTIAIGDLNGDGKPDLVTTNYLGTTVSVIFNTTPTGNATPTFSALTNFTVGSGPDAVSIGDLNGDGKPDLAVVNQTTSNVSVLFNTTPTGNATPTFSAKTDFTVGTNPNSVSIGDINGDGKPDLSVVNSGSSSISVLLNTTTTGNATPTFSAKTDFATGTNPYLAVIGDLNGDGKPDLATANNTVSTISVLFNNTTPGAATPTFTSKVDFTCGAQPWSVSIGDFNGDGKRDLATANYTGNSVSVLLNITPMGITPASFSAKTDFTVGSNPKSVSVGDINGDGKPDLAVANLVSSSVSVFLNTTPAGNATPTFSAKTDFTTGNFPYSVSIRDFNGDGKPDLVVANYGSNSVSVFLNTTTPGASTPTFSAKSDFTTGTNPQSVSTGDFNGDGKQDLAVANANSTSVSVFLNTTAPGASTPTFSAKTDFTTGSSPYSVSIGDFNGDGKPDLAVVNQGSNSVSVLLNTTTPGASTPTFSAKTDFTTGSSPYTVFTGDLNGDGKPDLAVANSGGNVSVLLNTTTPGASTPGFSAKTDFATGTGPQSVSICDLNGDGNPDLETANASGNTSVLLNTTTPGASTPTFSARTDFTTGSGSYSISISDFNGDGKRDLAVANTDVGNISVLLNTAALPLPVDLASFTSSVSSTTPYSVSFGDFNGDGKADMVTANFGANTLSVLINTTTPGASTPTFSAATDFVTGTGAYAVALGDLNGDGKPDVAVADYDATSVSVFFNTTTPGAVTPTFSAKTDFTTGTNPASISFSDFNGDGKPDMVVSNYGSNTISVFFNTTPSGNATPTFSAKTDFTTGTGPYSVSTGDFNGDGKSDIAVANYDATSVSVFLNTTTPGNATPTFSAKTDFTAGTNPASVAIRDLNGDGLPDLAVANYGSNSISTLMNTTAPNASTPTFSAKTDFATESGPYMVALGDFNCDGRPDMAATNYTTNKVSVYFNITTPGAAAPSFSSASNYTVGTAPSSVTFCDLNGDGKADLSVGNETTNNVSVFMNVMTLGVTPASFSAATAFGTGTLPRAVKFADINGDGKPDMIVGNSNLSASSVSVFLNTTATGGATPTFTAKTDFSVAGSVLSITICDINGDGKLDIAGGNLSPTSFSVLLNTTTPGASTPTFSARTDFATATGNTYSSAADINGDGKPDLVSANSGGGSVSVLLNTTPTGSATPTFSTKVDFTVGTTAQSLAIGDINGDGKPDLVAGNVGSTNVSVLLNTTSTGSATPTFSAKTDFTTGTSPRGISIGDFNGDGKPDLAVTNFTDNSVSVFLNTTTPGASTPAFSAKTDFNAGVGTSGISIGDLNGDGMLDLITANFTASSVSVLLNTTTPGASTPTFSVKTDFAVTNPRLLTIGDLNGDGKPDVAAGNNGATNTVSVLFNTISLPLPVELTSFASIVNSNNVTLNWSTTQEHYKQTACKRLLMDLFYHR
ncbi:unnamed protein product [Rotaria sp. Silwood1]|nr:unnamed protein product [Rotaria sp. Silwood1]CAF4560668.1 unnamed protein product [Rotaria sp. Silwood1]